MIELFISVINLENLKCQESLIRSFIRMILKTFKYDDRYNKRYMKLLQEMKNYFLEKEKYLSIFEEEANTIEGSTQKSFTLQNCL
jgi:hypothetical protein